MVLTTKVVLATAHLDHNPSNNKRRNLKAYCQRCHMLHDREEHRRRRRIALRKKNALGDLFLGAIPISVRIEPQTFLRTVHVS
jgi:hypothetical protein